MVFFIWCTSANTLFAAVTDLRSVTINWTMSDTSGVQGYRIYYDIDISMANKVWLNDCSFPIENPPYTFSITCNNVNIVSNVVYYFVVAAVMTDGSEIFSSMQAGIFKTYDDVFVNVDQYCNGETPCYPVIGEGYGVVEDGGSVMLRAGEYYEALVFDKPKMVTLTGGFLEDYCSNPLTTTVVGGCLIISDGCVVVEGLVLK